MAALLTLQFHKRSFSVTKKPDSSTKHRKKIHLKSWVAPGHDSSTVSLAVLLQTADTQPSAAPPNMHVTGGGLRRKEEGRAHWRDIVTNLMLKKKKKTQKTQMSKFY